jgi:RNA polymerase sigma-70 factor (ECF subfamily)
MVTEARAYRVIEAVTGVVRDERARSDLAAALAGHEAALLTTARFLTGDEAEARDVVQQTLEIALRHLDELRDPDRLGPWLTTIAVREALRLRRRVRRLVRLDALVREIPAAGGPDERSVALRDAVGRLPNRVRAAVVLHYMVGLSVDETAAAMAVSPNTIKSELKSGLRRLREMLQ